MKKIYSSHILYTIVSTGSLATFIAVNYVTRGHPGFSPGCRRIATDIRTNAGFYHVLWRLTLMKIRGSKVFETTSCKRNNGIK